MAGKRKTVRLSSENEDRLRDIAKKTGRSENELVNVALKQFFINGNVNECLEETPRGLPTPRQDAIIAALRNHPEGMQWRELGNAVGRAPSGIGDAIKLLEKKGMVHRIKIKSPDRRHWRTHLYRKHQVLIKLGPACQEIPA